LIYWGGGEPRELLRVSGPDQFILTGWMPDGLRDVSTHPDGRRIAFNAGWKRANSG
jgi:hypothetical protein